jgi:hypothetical protein
MRPAARRWRACEERCWYGLLVLEEAACRDVRAFRFNQYQHQKPTPVLVRVVGVGRSGVPRRAGLSLQPIPTPTTNTGVGMGCWCWKERRAAACRPFASTNTNTNNQHRCWYGLLVLEEAACRGVQAFRFNQHQHQKPTPALIPPATTPAPTVPPHNSPPGPTRSTMRKSPPASSAISGWCQQPRWYCTPWPRSARKARGMCCGDSATTTSQRTAPERHEGLAAERMALEHADRQR